MPPKSFILSTFTENGDIEQTLAGVVETPHLFFRSFLGYVFVSVGPLGRLGAYHTNGTKSYPKMLQKLPKMLQKAPKCSKMEPKRLKMEPLGLLGGPLGPLWGSPGGCSLTVLFFDRF